MTEFEQTFARQAVRRKGLFLKLSVASLIVAAGSWFCINLLLAGPQLLCRAPVADVQGGRLDLIASEQPRGLVQRSVADGAPHARTCRAGPPFSGTII